MYQRQSHWEKECTLTRTSCGSEVQHNTTPLRGSCPLAKTNGQQTWKASVTSILRVHRSSIWAMTSGWEARRVGEVHNTKLNPSAREESLEFEFTLK